MYYSHVLQKMLNTRNFYKSYKLQTKLLNNINNKSIERNSINNKIPGYNTLNYDGWAPIHIAAKYSSYIAFEWIGYIK